MNKLIITGNGFDLAHKLPTSYTDFIKWFWVNICKEYDNELFNELYYLNPKFSSRFQHISSLDNQSNLINEVKNGIEYDGLIKEDTYDKTKLMLELDVFSEYKNIFFRYLNSNFKTHNWVDIEMCYYQLLKDESLRNSLKIFSVKDLNNQFEKVKNLFEYYLKNVVLPFIKLDEDFIKLEIIDLFIPIAKTNLDYNSKYRYYDYLKEFDQKYHIQLDQINEKIINRNSHINEIDLPKLLFLDFNYTNTVDLYKDILERRCYPYSNIDIIKIHGEIDNKSNPINFGFGDEMDSQYKVLENYNDNEYLKNIKSFHYFYNQNYRDLMNWIELGNYQIIIMGHSCGLSDRTLLNTLFEHEKCASIKFFYYKNKTVDNYTDIIQNISRHFNDKKVMRNKIVNKSLTKPLPQK